jgi:hypothetical protein
MQRTSLYDSSSNTDAFLCAGAVLASAVQTNCMHKVANVLFSTEIPKNSPINMKMCDIAFSSKQV